MKKAYIFLLLMLTVISASLIAEKNLTYIEFNTTTFNELETEIQKIHEQGGRVYHIFPPNAVYADIPSYSQKQINGAGRNPFLPVTGVRKGFLTPHK